MSNERLAINLECDRRLTGLGKGYFLMVELDGRSYAKSIVVAAPMEILALVLVQSPLSCQSLRHASQ